MKAIVMSGAGGPEVLTLQDLPEPTLQSPGDIKVRLRAAGINPIDAKLRRRGFSSPDMLPAVLGCDGAGVVVEIGAGVSRFRPGDAVWFCDGGIGGGQGCYAEYKVMDQQIARAMPATLSFAEAAAGPLVLITAWEALHDRARVQKGHTVLIHAAAGGVGHIAVQLAALAGARVIGTTSSVEKAQFVRALGAEQCILYHERDFVEAVSAWTNGQGVDVALDTVGGEVFHRSFEAVAHYGDLVTLLEPGADLSWKEARNRNLRIGFELMLTPMQEGLSEARAHQGDILDRSAEWLAAGKLRIHVSETLPLEAAGDAHRLIEQGHMLGKVVLEISE